jgi:hypothetical protein
VRTDLMPTGQYATVVTLGGDHVWHLDRAAALEYAATCVAIATAAEHDTAVMRLLLSLDLPLPAAAEVLAGLRWHRSPQVEVLRGLRLMAGVAFDGEDAVPPVRPFIETHTPISKGQMDTPTLRRHAGGVLSSIAGVELDTTLFGVLTSGSLGLERARARAVVAGLRDHWPGGQSLCAY